MVDHPLKQRFVIDTTTFITEEIREGEENVEEAVERLLDLIAEAKLKLHISCYIPPSVYDELAQMLEDRGVSDEVLSKLNTWLIKKNPDRFTVMIPAEIVYEFIEEMSNRVNRGLRVSEKAVRKAEESKDSNNGTEMSEVDKVISDLRSEYRSTLRRGILDSREDFDLLILARELEAGVVTEDTGIIRWAEDFGLRYLKGRDFPSLLSSYLAASDTDAA